jgi:hypothetical protein
VAYFELNPRRLNPLFSRACPHCEVRMSLAVIQPAKPGRDKLIFECTECGREGFVEVKMSDEPERTGIFHRRSKTLRGARRRSERANRTAH